MMTVLIFLTGLIVYGGYGLPGLGYLLAATLIAYLAARLTPRFRWAAWISILLNAAMVLALKLQPITGWSLLAPMGVSYFSLQLIAYNADVLRGKYEAERNIFRFGLFVTYLPQLFIGPISRYDALAPALFENRKITWDGIFAGAARALWGLFKKMVIAARIGVVISTITADTAAHNGAYALAAMLLYSIQLYSDFSGGMDTVLGISQMLGVKLAENFDAPYFSQSFQEFWKRWHMTLGGWLRDYIYIPLGGNRKGTLRKILNTLVTFLVSGLWHGVEYLLWGLFNGILVCFGKRLQTPWKTLNRVGTFLLVSLLWSFFIWPDAATALSMVASLFTTFNYAAFASGIGELGLTVGDWIVLGAAALLLWGYDAKAKKIKCWFANLCPAAKTAVICALGLTVLVFGMYGLGFQAEAFIYSKF